MPARSVQKYCKARALLAMTVIGFFFAHCPPAMAENPALDAAGGALKKGKFGYALKTINKVLRTGNLNTRDMSKALFYRGLAYQAQKKPAQSIADLTNAIWMGGLSTAERAEALKYRALAYQEGGVSDRAKADRAEAVRLAKGLPKISQTLGTPARPVTGTSSGSGGFASGITSGISDFFGNLLPGGSSGTATSTTTTTAISKNASIETASNGVKTAESAAWAAGSTVTTAPETASAPSASAMPKPKPATVRPVVTGWSTAVDQPAKVATKPKTPSSGGFGFGGVSNFFGNIFGGTSPAPSAKKPVPTTVPEPALGAQKPTRTAALDITKPAPASAAPSRGRFKLQIATVRSQDEANTIVSSLIARHGTVLASHPARIDEAVVGNMGTFYRVRLEAFDSEKTALKTCNALRASGLDCFPVAR